MQRPRRVMVLPRVRPITLLRHRTRQPLQRTASPHHQLRHLSRLSRRAIHPHHPATLRRRQTTVLPHRLTELHRRHQTIRQHRPATAQRRQRTHLHRRPTARQAQPTAAAAQRHRINHQRHRATARLRRSTVRQVQLRQVAVATLQLLLNSHQTLRAPLLPSIHPPAPGTRPRKSTSNNAKVMATDTQADLHVNKQKIFFSLQHRHRTLNWAHVVVCLLYYIYCSLGRTCGSSQDVGVFFWPSVFFVILFASPNHEKL